MRNDAQHLASIISQCEIRAYVVHFETVSVKICKPDWRGSFISGKDQEFPNGVSCVTFSLILIDYLKRS